MGASEGPQAKDEMLFLCTYCGDGFAQPPAALRGVGVTIKQECFVLKKIIETHRAREAKTVL